MYILNCSVMIVDVVQVACCIISFKRYVYYAIHLQSALYYILTLYTIQEGFSVLHASLKKLDPTW